MADLPTGTVTFFFSDVEGSTGLLQRLGPGSRAVLGEHADIVRSVVAGADGVEVKTMGDGFFVVFRSAGEGVEAAAEVQRRHHRHSWPEGGTVRVRVGLHTGEGRLGANDYEGIDVHRAARIGEAGHGG